MPRGRSQTRRQAYQLWRESDGKRKLTDIAAQLNVPPGQVRKWKSTDKWELEAEKERSQTGKGTFPNENGNVPKRKRGGQPDNINAVGNSGGTPPLGNNNALKHGGYSPAYWDTLTEEERELLAAPDHDAARLLQEEIDLLSVRERRIMARIRKLTQLDEKAPGGMGQAVAGVMRMEEKREFDSQEDKALYEEIQRAKIDSGKQLPGRKYTVTTRTEATYDVIHRLEDALTRCQAQKQRCIRNLMDLRRDQAADQMEIEDLDSLEAEIYGGGQDSGNSPGGKGD